MGRQNPSPSDEGWEQDVRLSFGFTVYVPISQAVKLLAFHRHEPLSQKLTQLLKGWAALWASTAKTIGPV